jgi:alkylhydroperoxidase/carboxymuconolactone decarboxylase family protein YurZ
MLAGRGRRISDPLHPFGTADWRLEQGGTLRTAEETLRRLAIAEPSVLSSIDAHYRSGAAPGPFDDRTEALLRVAALIALDAPETSYAGVIASALLAGATLDELVAVLFSVAGSVGSARILSAAPRIAMAAGYDVEHAIESSDTLRR